MRQFIGSRARRHHGAGLPRRPRAARRSARRWAAVEAAELALMDPDDETAPAGLRARPHALGRCRRLRRRGALGHRARSPRSACRTTACKYREVATLSGGEQKRLALEALLRGPDEVLLLDEPDNYLDVPGKRWLEDRLRETAKTVLFVSHDRELLAQVADRIVTVEGATVWVHGGGFATLPRGRTAKHERMAELRRRWDEEHARLIELVRTLQQQAKVSDAMAAKYRAMARLERFEAAGPPPDKPTEQQVTMRLRGGRTGVRAVICEGWSSPGSCGRSTRRSSTASGSAFSARTAPASRTSCGCSPASRSAHPGHGGWAPRVVPGPIRPDPRPPRPGWTGRSSICSGTASRDGRASIEAARWRRCAGMAWQQQARPAVRFPVGRAAGAVPDPAARAVRRDPAAARRADRQPRRDSAPKRWKRRWTLSTGTVLAVTHDRWFARSFDRFLVFGADGASTSRTSRSSTRRRVQRALSPAVQDALTVRPVLTDPLGSWTSTRWRRNSL